MLEEGSMPQVLHNKCFKISSSLLQCVFGIVDFSFAANDDADGDGDGDGDVCMNC